MSDLRAMLIEARGERCVGDMVQLRASEVDALIEALGATHIIDRDAAAEAIAFFARVDAKEAAKVA